MHKSLLFGMLCFATSPIWASEASTLEVKGPILDLWLSVDGECGKHPELKLPLTEPITLPESGANLIALEL
jgi:hypothetical protein